MFYEVKLVQEEVLIKFVLNCMTTERSEIGALFAAASFDVPSTVASLTGSSMDPCIFPYTKSINEATN